MRHRFWSYRHEVIERELMECEPMCRRCNQAHALAWGVGRPGAKLSTADVQEIRKRAGATSTRDLAAEFEVSPETIRNVVTYKTFKTQPVAFATWSSELAALPKAA
jgi:hypothetical protein